MSKLMEAYIYMDRLIERGNDFDFSVIAAVRQFGVDTRELLDLYKKQRAYDLEQEAAQEYDYDLMNRIAGR